MLDSQEREFGTDPANPDTDSDGFTDGFEMLMGTAPSDPASAPPSPSVLRVSPLARPAVDAVDPDFDGLPSVYESEIGTDSAQADSDNDGYGDGIELLNGTSPLDASVGRVQDSDGDGLSDSVEATLGSNPLLRDEDGDLLSDPQEFFYLQDPKNPDSNRDGILDGWQADARTYRFTNKQWHFGNK